MKRIILLVLLVASVGGGIYYKFFYHSKAQRSLRLALETIVDQLDPVKIYNDDALTLQSQSLEPLYQYHYLKRPYEIVPLVTEGMPDISTDGKEYVIHIKDNVLYHDHPAFRNRERKLMAQDFVMQFKRLAFIPLKSPFRSYFADLILGFDEFAETVGDDWKKIPTVPLKGVVAQNDLTLKISLKRPEPNLIYYLAMTVTAPVPWEIVKYTKNDLSETMIGTGPYFLVSRTKEEIYLEKFAKYREDFYPTVGDRYAYTQKLLQSSREKIPFVKNVTFYVMPVEDERWEKFLKHDLDILNVPKSFLPRLFEKKSSLLKEFTRSHIQMKHFPVQALRWFSFNMRDPFWGKNVKLRQAVAYAMDVDAYVKQFSQMTNLKAHTLLVPGLSGYLPSTSFGFSYDPEQAKDILREAGYPEGKGLAPLTYYTRGDQAIHIAEAEFVKNQLAKVGIKVEYVVLTFSQFLQKGRAGELQFFTDNWLFDYPDGENLFQLLISRNSPGINKSGYKRKEVDQLYEQLRTSSDPIRKADLMYQIEGLVMEDMPWIPLMYESSYIVIYDNVQNYRKSSMVRNFVKYIKFTQGLNI